MDVYNFEKGITRLKIFFPTFKPSEVLLKEWFKLLSKNHSRAWHEAIDAICMTCGRCPTFPELNAMVRQKQARYSVAKFWVCDSGAAPFTDELKSLSKDMMRQLRQAMAEERLNAETKTGLIEIWHNCYRKLPGYKSAEQVREMVAKERFDELLELGVIEGGYIKGQGSIGFQGMR